MKTTPPPRHHHARAAGRLLGAMFGVWLLGAVYTPAVAATSAVTVDQQPLTLQPPIPPNITLMLDDSGSMAWDYMPDACYLQGVVCTGSQNGTASPSGFTDYISTVNNSAVIDAANNGVYYNPAIVYTPPPTASGGSYSGYTDFTNVPVDGFGAVSGVADLTNYSNYDLQGEAESSSHSLYYSYKSTTTYTVTFNQTVTSKSWGTASQVCQYDFNYYNGNGTGPTFTGTSGGASGTCVFTYNKRAQYFQYSTGAAAGPWTVRYVAPASQGCIADSKVTPGATGNCVVDSDTSGTAAPAKDASGNALTAGANIANWFAYYHTRIQMAKSGLMTAFSTVNKAFRVGFGSIDGGCNGVYNSTGVNDDQNLPSAASTATPYSYTDTYNCGQGGSTTNKIASVQPFGNGSSSTDQKNGFWNWVAKLSPAGGTPLRAALDAVGQYYETPQPWTTMSSDPSTTPANTYIACRQSYTILTTDGFWNGNYTSSTTLGASDTGFTMPGPNGQSYTYTPAAPYNGGDTADGSPSLADVAMYYWKTDLASGTGTSPNIANEVPINSADPAFWQHMTTFTMGLGFTPIGIAGSATSTGTPTVTDKPPTISDIFGSVIGKETLSSDFGWPTPASNSIYNISDLAHAGVNGHGGFYSATNPQTFAAGISDALKSAGGRNGTGASLAANSTQLNNGTVAYQAKYHTSTWTGELDALPIDSTTGAIGTTSNTGGWSTASTLTASMAGSRNIWTYNPTGTTAATQYVAFQDSTSTTPPALSTAELNALGSSSAAQVAMVNYLRGDKTLEQNQGNGGTFRDRNVPLGDIVDSQPVYSGAPNVNEYEGQSFAGITPTTAAGTIPDNSFQTWAVGYTDASGTFHASTVPTRESLVFVAANDGMLHAFDATTGAEKYAYLPAAVITAGLANLANTAYGSSADPHQYYNDGELTIADAFFNSAWHTVLVGTTGRGPAEAVYALDVTDPTNIKFLWERSAGDTLTNSNYIGQMVGKPVIAKVQDGTSSDWQVLIGNGYNSASGQAALLEFDLATGTLSVHTTTSRISTAGNGLAAAVTWMNDASTGVSTDAFAGDLQGQVWDFPLGTAKTKSGTTTYVSDPSPLGGVSTTGTLVFSTPLDTSGNPQPITAGMLAGRDPTTGNVWLFFGTGQYLSSNDLTNKQVESWYGVIAQSGSPSATTSNATVSNLVQRYITYEQAGNPSATPPTLGVRTVTTPTDTGYVAIGSKLGWYMNLKQPILNSDGSFSGNGNTQGERMVTPNQFQGNLLLATTRIPVVTDICNPSGSGWVMAVNPFTGTNPSGNFFTGNGGGTVTLPSGKVVPAAGVGFSSLPNNPIFVGGDMLMSFDNGTTSSLMTTGSTGALTRVSWQELVNP